jgi:hypothetical protein
MNLFDIYWNKSLEYYYIPYRYVRDNEYYNSSNHEGIDARYFGVSDNDPDVFTNYSHLKAFDYWEKVDSIKDSCAQKLILALFSKKLKL